MQAGERRKWGKSDVMKVQESEGKKLRKNEVEKREDD